MKNILISTAEDVAALASDVKTGKRRYAGKIRVKLEGMERDVERRLTRKVNRHYFSCGSGEAILFALVGLAAGSIWVIDRAKSWQSVGWAEVLVFVGVFSIAICIGKGLGRWRDRQFLDDVVDQLLTYEPDALNIGSRDTSVKCQG